MRHFVGLFGLACSAIVIAVAARYGFTLSKDAMDGSIWAFIFGAVTFAGLGGHMVGVRLWRYRKRLFALVIFAAASFALVISLSNSLGAMAGRMNTTAADRTKTNDAVTADQTTLTSKQTERNGLKFKPTDKDVVDAAKSKATAATAAREAECKIRGQRCRDKEEDETKALADLTTASTNKASTEYAKTLEADIKELKEKIGQSGPVLEANSAGSALARLFNLPGDENAARLSTYQQLAMAVVIEIIIMLSLITYEIMTEHELERMPKPAQAFAPVEPAALPVEIEPDEALAIAPPVIEHDIEEEEPEEPAAPVTRPGTLTFSAHPRPRLIASRPDPVGSVPDIMAEIMEPGRGKVEVAIVFAAYAEACKRSGKRPMAAEEFTEALGGLCQQLGVKIEATAKGVYLLKVRLKKSGKEAKPRVGKLWESC